MTSVCGPEGSGLWLVLDVGGAGQGPSQRSKTTELQPQADNGSEWKERADCTLGAEGAPGKGEVPNGVGSQVQHPAGFEGGETGRRERQGAYRLRKWRSILKIQRVTQRD